MAYLTPDNEPEVCFWKIHDASGGRVSVKRPSDGAYSYSLDPFESETRLWKELVLKAQNDAAKVMVEVSLIT